MKKRASYNVACLFFIKDIDNIKDGVIISLKVKESQSRIKAK